MNAGFRKKVSDVASQAVDLLQKGISGKSNIEGGMFDKLIRITNQGIKVEHMDQIKEQGDRSFGLRLLSFMPKDELTRSRYIALTNPELKPILLAAPEKTNNK